MVNKTIESADFTKPDATAEIPAFGAARVEHEGVVEVDAGLRMQEKAEKLAFMEEPVTVFVHPMNDDDDFGAAFVSPGVNGRKQPICIGVDQTVKRKYVEVLARAVTRRYKQKKLHQVHDPEQINTMVGRSIQRYPFQIIHDANPKGADWLRAILTGG